MRKPEVLMSFGGKKRTLAWNGIRGKGNTWQKEIRNTENG